MGMKKMMLGELPRYGADPVRTGLVADRKTDADTYGLYQKIIIIKHIKHKQMNSHLFPCPSQGKGKKH